MYKHTPPMGWNTWNTFGGDASEQLLMEMADALVDTGLAECGYRYLVLDDCWCLKERDENGRLVADPVKFPHGMKYIADYVHAKGLKFGMYSDAGVMTCAGYPGSYEHEFVDAATFASWDVDFLKYDYCWESELTPADVCYRRMGLALANCGREILFSACSGGNHDTPKYIKETNACMWRSTDDINDSFESLRYIILRAMDNRVYNGLGCYNDLDMLIVGMYAKGMKGFVGCTDEEYLLHFAFWCLYGSPLMIGADVRHLSDAALKILSHKELIEIDQDPAYRTPISLGIHRECPVIARYLADGTIAIGIFNLDDNLQGIWHAAVPLDELGLPESCGKTLLLRDIITGEEHKVKNGYFYADTPAHTCHVYRATVIDQ